MVIMSIELSFDIAIFSLIAKLLISKSMFRFLRIIKCLNSKINHNLIQFLQKNNIFYTVCVLQMKNWNFLTFVLKFRVFSEKLLNLDKLVAANLNR